MTTSLMLVIVVVAGGVGFAAVTFLRSRQASLGSKAVARGEPTDAAGTRAAAAGPKQPDILPGTDSAVAAAIEPAKSAIEPPRPAIVDRASAGPGAESPPPRSTEELDFTLAVSPKPAGTVPSGAAGGALPTPSTPQSLQPAEVLAKLFQLALGTARPASTVTAGHDDVVSGVGAALEDVATQERYAPRRPNMLPKVLSASNDDSFSRRELAALIARDPSLVGNLLKIANSSYYRITPEPVESVDRAVVLLGTDGIRSLVTAALMQPIFRIGGADFPRFPDTMWEHTFRAASAAVPHNFLMEKSDPFAAELLSLVMGLAGIVIFRVAMDQYAKYPRLRPDAGVVSSLLDQHSATVARRIGAIWELSEPTLAGLDGQSTTTTHYPTPLGRSLYFGRVVGALAVLRINRVIDEVTARASIPPVSIAGEQLDRLWARLAPKPDKR